jgi:hypothetical protein
LTILAAHVAGYAGDDVLAQPGVRWLIILEGINDLGTCSATARDLIAAYEQIIMRCHARGIRVCGGGGD